MKAYIQAYKAAYKKAGIHLGAQLNQYLSSIKAVVTKISNKAIVTKSGKYITIKS